jgi:hypothetical protein
MTDSVSRKAHVCFVRSIRTTRIFLDEGRARVGLLAGLAHQRRDEPDKTPPSDMVSTWLKNHDFPNREDDVCPRVVTLLTSALTFSKLSNVLYTRMRHQVAAGVF